MGLFDHLFKSKTDPANEEHVETAPPAETGGHAGTALNVPPPKPPTIAPPDAFGPRTLGQVITPGRAGPPSPRPGPAEPRANTGDAGGQPAREIVLALDDVLARIPVELLVEGAPDGRRVLRFPIDALSADIARGRAAVPLSQIAAQCPDLFRVPIDEDNDILVRLPLQKLVEQIAPTGIATTLARSPAREGSDLKIHLSIAAILRTCPREIIVGELPPVADTEHVVFPFAPIERQLPSGRVDVSSIRFVAALPLHMHEYFRAIEGVRVPLPLDEIFQNLPGQPAAPAVAPIPASTPAPPSAPPPSPPTGGTAWTPAPTPPPVAAPVSEVAPAPAVAPAPVSTPVAEPIPPVQPMRAAEPLAGPPPVSVAATPPAPPPASPRPEPHLDLAKDEIAALRARIAALKVEFSVLPVASVTPVASPRVETPPSVEVPPSPAAPPPAETSPQAATPPFPGTPLPVELPPVAVTASAPATEPMPSPVAPVTPPVLFAPASGFRPAAPPPLGFEPPPSVPPPAIEPAPEPVSAPVPAPLPELFRPPLVPPPVAPVVITTPKVDVPAPVMLPVRIVAPSPIRPHVAPPRLFSAGENVPQSEIHAPEPVAPPEPPPPPPPPPLVLDRAATLLGLEGEPTLARVAEQLAALPGLAACVLEVRHEAAQAGSFSQGPDAASVRALIAPLAAAVAGREGEHITIFGEHGSVSVFARGEARLAILHRARVFLPGIREKLIATADALADA